MSTLWLPALCALLALATASDIPKVADGRSVLLEVDESAPTPVAKDKPVTRVEDDDDDDDEAPSADGKAAQPEQPLQWQNAFGAMPGFPGYANGAPGGMQGMPGFGGMQGMPGFGGMQGMPGFGGMQGMPGMPMMPGMNMQMPPMNFAGIPGLNNMPGMDMQGMQAMQQGGAPGGGMFNPYQQLNMDSSGYEKYVEQQKTQMEEFAHKQGYKSIEEMQIAQQKQMMDFQKKQMDMYQQNMQQQQEAMQQQGGYPQGGFAQYPGTGAGPFARQQAKKTPKHSEM